jgi:hypothetical protein
MLSLKGLIAIISIGLSAFLAFWFNQPTDKVNVTELMQIGRGQIISTHYSPDKSTFVVASTLGLWLYDTADWTAEPRLLRSKGLLIGFSYTANGAYMVGFMNDRVQVWDMASLSLIATMDRLDYSYFHKPYFRADSLYLIDEGVPDVMWDVETGEILPLVADKTDMPHPAIDFKYDGDGLVLTILDGDDAGQVYRLGGYSRDVIDGAISPDGRFIGKLGKGYLELLDAQDGQSIWRTELPDERDLYRMEFSPNSERIIIFPREGVITVWDVATGAGLADFEGDKRWDPYMTYHPDKALVALGTVDGEVWVWDIETGVALYRLTGGQSQRHAHFSSDGTMILSSGYFGTNDVLIWDVATGEKRSEFNFGFDASFSVDSQSLLGIVGDRLMRWDLETGTLLPVVRDNAIDVDYKWFVIPDDAGTVEYRMAQVHHYIRGLMDRAGRRRIIHTTFSADFSRVVTFEVDGTIRVWGIPE